MPTPQRGQIVEAWVNDPQGHNRKRRPLVIVSATDNIKPGKAFHAVSITSKLSNPLPDDHVELPWHADRRQSRTGLTKRCAVVCTWLEKISEEDIEEYRGRVPDKVMLDILSKIDSLEDL